MVLVNKEEKEAILKSCPRARFFRTVKQKSKRHHYYVEESKLVMYALNEYREAKKIVNDKKKK